ncbi:alpha/beta fold hydrolase [Telmatospirillum sp. J64-1]|uniref:alpha/beta fold hydrolase n=1 Tax=Telmatospirillum sp. J64-1 TaxID=2502183 RepID=UPI00115C6B48|nr:alpha/beta hydrolase [Telmatospirillum sp. J64-1]
MSPIPLILLPGLLCDATLWRHQTETLTDLASPIVADLTQDESIAAMARRVLETAPPRFALAGLSMGGYVAQEILRQAPERVLGLALLDTNARADRPEQSEQRRALIDLTTRGRFKGVTPRLLPALIHHDRLSDQHLTAAVMRMAENVGQEAFVRQQTAIMGRKEGLEDLRAITCPTLILCGRQDALTPPKVHDEMAERIPHARMIVIEDCGHLPPMERPHATSAVMRYWLQDLAA